MKTLNIDAIRIDGGTQARVEINNEAVSEYAEALQGGAGFPPVVVFFDGADHWLADGFHRYHAHRQAGRVSIHSEVREGAQREARLFSLGANQGHGIRRSNADKRKAVESMLADPEWAKWSNNAIAKHCGVSDKTVAHLRNSEDRSAPTPAVRKVERAGKVYEQDTTNIGKPATEPKAKRSLAPETPPEFAAPSADDEVAELRHTIKDLADENQQLQDRLAVESMDASEEAKTDAARTIAELRERVRQLETEVDVLKASRDTYMRESSEKTRQINYWRKQAEKAAKESA